MASPTTAGAGAAMPAFVPVYSAFAAAYLLSYLFRTVNAVISPELTRDLGLDASSLGFLTSAYFFAFGLMQIPVGMLLDRYGPRRVEPVLLATAAAGALLFALADGLPGLTLGRAIIGGGVSACLMAPLKGIAMWYPPERHASLSGWMMVAGGLGALAATTPLEYALRFTGWRTIFVGLAAATIAVALWIAWRVPDTQQPASTASVRAQFKGVRAVFTHPRFWWIAPLAAFGMGSFFAVQALWAVPWMMEVEGLTRTVAASRLLGMNFATLLGYLFLGLFATALERRHVRATHLFAAGFILNALSLSLIATDLPLGTLWWWLYGLGASANVLAFTVLNEGFPRELAGRTNTAANLMMFSGGFALQWGIGLIVDATLALGGVERTAALRYAFSVVLFLDVAAVTWFLRGWKRFSVHELAPASA